MRDRIRSCPELGLALLSIVKKMIPMYEAWAMTGAGGGQTVTEANNRALKYRAMLQDIETNPAFNFETDPNIPPGEVHFRNAVGETLGKITGLQHDEPNTDSSGVGQ